MTTSHAREGFCRSSFAPLRADTKGRSTEKLRAQEDDRRSVQDPWICTGRVSMLPGYIDGQGDSRHRTRKAQRLESGLTLASATPVPRRWAVYC